MDNTTRDSILRKLRIYSNEVARITVLLENEDITQDEAEEQLIALDERFADRILSVKL